MKIHNVKQGSLEWHELRGSHYTASEAPAMMGVSKYMTRNDLLKQDATGLAPEIDAATQRRFNNGHTAEAGAREIAEEIIGETLFPATVSAEVDGLPLLASLDGLTLNGDIQWEHKLWNEDLAQQVRDCHLHPMYLWQVCHQFVVTGAKKTLFMVSDGTRKNCVWLWVVPKESENRKLIAGWKQYKKDLMNFEHVEVAPAAVGKAPESLPALRIEVQGMVTASNLAEFKAAALSLIKGVNTDLQTDQDFADAEKAVKWAKDVEQRLEAAKDHALSQTETIDLLFRTIDEIKEEARNTRLVLERAVKGRKEAIRFEIAAETKAKWLEYIAKINDGLGKIRLPEVALDVANAMKGKKTVQTLRDAADGELARAKIEASELAQHIQKSLEILRTDAGDHKSLFADAQALVTKDHDDLRAVIKNRIAQHKEEEKFRLEQEARAKEAMAVVDEAVRNYTPPEKPRTVGDVLDGAVISIASREQRQQPTLDEMLDVLAQHYRTDRETVLSWINHGIWQADPFKKRK